MDSRSGELIGGKYHLGALLGTGHLGQVYEAEQVGLRRLVTVKIMHEALLDNDTLVERFRSEAQAASRINHPHAVAMFDFGVTQDGLPFIVMERLRGRKLRSLLDEEKRLPAERAVTIAAQILLALEEAHSSGVVHGYLTGESVMVQQVNGEDFTKVVDFNVARLIDASRSGGSSRGTIEYMAPEVTDGSAATPASDLYAVGILLYEMIAGRTPFGGAAAPRPPRELEPSCPQSLSDGIMVALDRSPRARFPDAAHFREWLLASLDATGRARTCGACASPIAPTDRSCSRCGAPLLARGTRPPPEFEQPLPRPEFHAPPPRRNPTAASITCRLPPDATSPLLGRVRELARVSAFLLGAEHGRRLAILGPPGSGRSSLVTEAARQVAPDIVTFMAGPDPTGLEHPWYPVMSMLSGVLGLPQRPTYLGLVATVGKRGLPERDAPGLAEIFGLAGPLADAELAVRRREALAAARRALASPKHATALCFADIDRYDEPSRRLVTGLAEALVDDGPRLIVTAESQALTEGMPSLILGPLDSPSAGELLMDLAGPQSHENLEAARGATRCWPGHIMNFAAWIDEGNDPISAPVSQIDLLVERICRLPSLPRLLLQALASWGQIASRGDVVAMLADHGGIAAALALLVRAGHLIVDGQTLIIPTPLLREAVVACTPPEVQRRLARGALARLGDDEQPALRARLAEAAGDAATAEREYLRAGHDAERRFDDRGAARFFERARRSARARVLRGEDGVADLLVEASVYLADVLRYTGDLGLASACLAEAELGDLHPRHHAALARARGRIAMSGKNPRQAIQEFRAAIGYALRNGRTDFLCLTYLELAKACCAAGDIRQAIAELTEATDLIAVFTDETSLPDGYWMLGLYLAELQARAGRLDLARAAAESALRHAEEIGNRRGRGRVHAVIAEITAAAGDQRKAQRHRAAALEALRAMGDRRSTAELLLACARSTGELVIRDGHEQRIATDRKALLLAGELAAEVGWREGAEAARRETMELGPV